MPTEAADPYTLVNGVIARAAKHGVPVDANVVIAVLSSAVSDDPTLPATDPSKYVIPHTRLFVNAPDVIDIGWDVATAAALCATFHDGPQAAIATALQHLLRMMRLLTPEEADLIVVLTALAGGDPTTRAVPTQRIEQAYEEDAPKVAPLLRHAAQRGILIETHHGWQLVP